MNLFTLKSSDNVQLQGTRTSCPIAFLGWN